MFYLAPTRGAITFRAVARSRNVVAPLVGARRIHKPRFDTLLGSTRATDHRDIPTRTFPMLFFLILSSVPVSKRQSLRIEGRAEVLERIWPYTM